jgi:FAD/FMN-containing dehydrogenase
MCAPPIQFCPNLPHDVAAEPLQRFGRGDFVAFARTAVPDLDDAVGGTATRFRSAEAGGGVFTALPAPILELHRRIKQEFDPRGLFNPGRLVAGF